VRPCDQAPPREKARSQRLVLARRAHRHRERLAVDADLERLLDGQLVAVVPALGAADALDRRTRHVPVEGRVHPQIIAPRGRETTRAPTSGGAACASCGASWPAAPWRSSSGVLRRPTATRAG